MSGSDRAAERVARKLAEWRYEHGADCGGLDKVQWVEANWMEFTGEARVAIWETVSMLPAIAFLEPHERQGAAVRMWETMGHA